MRKKKVSKYENAYPLGHKFGLWELVETTTHRLDYGGGTYGEPAYRVRCGCGKEKLVSCTRLVKGISTSCRCWMYQPGDLNPNWKGVGEIPGRYVSRIENGAKKRNIEYTIDGQLMLNQLQAQNYSCSLSGQPLYFGMAHGEHKTNASLDRIDSTKGYVSGNIQWVTKQINLSKQSFTQDQFIEMCKQVTTYKG